VLDYVMFIFRKNKEIYELLEKYLQLTLEELVEFEKTFSKALKKGVTERVEALAERAHQVESDADDVRREIEIKMYAKSLLPESRQDLLEVIELIDRIPDKAETILNMLITQRTALIEPIKNDMKELLRLSVETARLVVETTRDCFGKMENIRDLARKIDDNESMGDKLERKMISLVFRQKLDMGEKFEQKEFILQLGAICDLCERAKDKLVITSIKREV